MGLSVRARRLRDLFFVTLSAALLAAPYHRGELGGLAFVAFLPYLAVLDSRSSSEAFRASFLFGFLFYLGIGYPLILVSWVGYVALAAYLALYFGLAGLLSARWMDPSAELAVTVYRRNVRSLFVVPAVWVLFEYARGWALSGAPLAFLGYSQWKNLPLIQIADVTGVYGVSYLVVFVNLALYKLLRELRGRPAAAGSGGAPPLSSPGISRRRYAATLALLAAAALGGTALYGTAVLGLRDAPPDPARPKAVLRVSVVQGNIPQDQKWDARIKSIIFEKYKRLTLMAALEKPDLILWPETSFPGYLEDETLLAAGLRSLARHAGADVLVGAPTLGDIESQGVRFYNSAVLLAPDGTEKGRYSKLHLVPFGEYVPFEPLFGAVRRFVDIGAFSPGREHTLFRAVSYHRERRIEAKFAALICYEDMFPGLVRRFRREGADFLVNITNDAWFGPTVAAAIHGQASVFRAVENRIPVVRAANTGWSSFISPEGRILGAVSDGGRELFVTGHATRDLVLRRGTSFYTRFGDVFVLLLVVLCAMAYRDHTRQAYSRL